MQVTDKAQFEQSTLEVLTRPAFIGVMLVMGRHQPCNNVKVAKILGTQFPYISQMFKLMREQKLIKEVETPQSNGRTKFYELTSKGSLFANCYWELVELWQNG